MATVTLLIAIAGAILAFSVRPIYGLAAYAVVSIWYPYTVGTVSIGTIDFSVGRIVIITLYAKVFLTTEFARNFKLVWLDRLVLILFAAEVAAGIQTIAPMRLIENRLGDFFDMALPYFAVRLIVRKREDYISLLKIIAWSTAILAVFAIYESLTECNLLGFGRTLNVQDKRLGLWRAQATFRDCIYMGVFFAMTGAFCTGLVKNVKKNRKLYTTLVGLMFLGCFSSLSSGGLLAMVGALLFIGFFRHRHYWKQAILAVVLMCALVEMMSNRHFYSVIDRVAFSGSTAWYRARLFEVAFFEGGMSGHWLCGYGFEDPRWSEKIDMRSHTDMVNHYLMKLSCYGLIGFVPFCAVIIIAIKNLFKGFFLLRSDSDAWLVWCTAGALLGVLLAFNSVSLFGGPMIILFMMFGFCAKIPEVLLEERLNE